MAKLTATEFNTPEYFGYGYVTSTNVETGLPVTSSVPLPGGGYIPGGYGLYQPVINIINPIYGIIPNNDVWGNRAKTFISKGGLVGLKTLELGCGFGPLVRAMRLLGANAYGLDLSWPISQGLLLWPELQPYLIVADAVSWLQSTSRIRNEYEAVISKGFLECLTDAELALIIPRINFICKSKQIHIVDPDIDPAYYNTKTLVQWQALPWEAGTLILDES